MAHRWLLGLVSLGALAFVACGETSRESDSNGDTVTGAGGGIASTDPDVTTATQSGTTGTGGASALATNVMAGSTSASTTGGEGAPMHCHTLQEVDEAIETIGYGPFFGNGGQGGAQPSEECPRYYPTPYGPPCGGELLPGSTEARCCYSYVDCN